MRELALRTWGNDLHATDLGGSAEAFLEHLRGPSLIRIPGRNSERQRVVATLLHGNEPSGVRAMHRWLADGAEPAVDVTFFIGAVETALAPPGFGHRFLPGERDLNRCWLPPHPGEEGALARRVLEILLDGSPECLVDLHNNTGQNPAYGVTPLIGAPERNLVSLFAHRVVHTPLALGTLCEATCHVFPTVTVECGRSGDPRADDIALAGLRRMLASSELDLGRPPAPLEVFVDPVRVCVRPGVEIAFGDAPDPAAGFTVSRDIDRHNFELLEAGSPIGWVAHDCAWPIEARGAGEEDRSRDLFALRDGQLETRSPMVPAMMTTRREAALADCLFYAAQREPA